MPLPCPWPASGACRVLLGFSPHHFIVHDGFTSINVFAKIFRFPRQCQMEHRGSDNVRMKCWTCTVWSFLRQVSTASNLKLHQVLKTPLLPACFVRLLRSSSWRNVLAWSLCSSLLGLCRFYVSWVFLQRSCCSPSLLALLASWSLHHSPSSGVLPWHDHGMLLVPFSEHVERKKRGVGGQKEALYTSNIIVCHLNIYRSAKFKILLW